MSTITKERLEQLANFRGAPVTRQEEQELARIALASLEAEADAVCQHQWKSGGANKLQRQKQCVKCGRVELATQPAPVAVPDDFLCMLTGRAKYLRDKGEIKSPELLERAAAMLQGADGNSPVIPDGWVMVPVAPTEEMLAELCLVEGWTERALNARYQAMVAAAPKV